MSIAFTKVALPYGWLGNMAPYPLVYEGQIWRTAEALFQALRFNDAAIRTQIRLEASPMGAKMRAKSFAERMVVTPTSAEDRANMTICIKLKIDQHLDLATQLLATEDETIIEDVTTRVIGRNMFWGMAKVDGQWVGENNLGKMWMALRTQLRLEYTKP